MFQSISVSGWRSSVCRKAERRDRSPSRKEIRGGERITSRNADWSTLGRSRGGGPAIQGVFSELVSGTLSLDLRKKEHD